MDNWRQNIDKRLVLDNGSYSLRYGNHLFKNKSHNLIAQIKKTGQIIYDFDALFDESDVQAYYKPHVRGMLVNIDKQVTIWDRYINKIKDHSITFPYQPFTPEPIMNKLFEIMFEYYSIDGFCPILSQRMLCQDLTPFNYVVDSSHSATYFVPFFNGEIINKAVRRLDVGGRLLTNQLKEIISFKQFDLKNYYLLSTQIKEQLCFVSMDYNRDMKLKKKSIQKYYVLPDFDIKRVGYAVDELNVGFLDAKVALDKERITIPEILFHPIEIGLPQKGPIDTIMDSLKDVHSDLQGYFMENITLSGGNTLFKNYYTRFNEQLRQVCPIEWNMNVNHLNNIDAVFEGCCQFNQSTQFLNTCFTKQEFIEKGFDNIKQYLL